MLQERSQWTLSPKLRLSLKWFGGSALGRNITSVVGCLGHLAEADNGDTRDWPDHAAYHSGSGSRPVALRGSKWSGHCVSRVQTA
jgi:hypothetical protein